MGNITSEFSLYSISKDIIISDSKDNYIFLKRNDSIYKKNVEIGSVQNDLLEITNYKDILNEEIIKNNLHEINNLYPAKQNK